MIKDIFELQNPWRFDTNFHFNLKPRKLLTELIENLDNKKLIGITGSRQVGKSSLLFLLIEYLIKRQQVSPLDIFYFNLDDLKLHELFSDLPAFLNFIGKSRNRQFIFLDEVQRLENPGLFLKMLYDLNLNIKVIFTGSSQLEVRAKTKENLVGRARTFELQRLSFNEFIDFNHPITPKEALYEILIFGSYPEVALERDAKQKKLLIKDIYQTYIEKDISDYLHIDNITAFNNLLKFLAVNCGQLLNLENLSKSLRINRTLTEKYIQVLESTFIIKRIYPFYKNYKKEIVKTPKLYFLDLGLRNFAINNFNEPQLRNDIGILFENFYLLELLANDPSKLNKINFWRTTNQTEIDFIVQNESGIEAIETKWTSQREPRSFITIKKYYPEIQTRLITKETFVRV